MSYRPRVIIALISALALVSTLMIDTFPTTAQAKSIASRAISAGPNGPDCTTPSATTITLVNSGEVKTYSVAALTLCASYAAPNPVPTVTPTQRPGSTPTASPSFAPSPIALPSPTSTTYSIGNNPAALTASIAGDVLTVSTSGAAGSSTLEIIATYTYVDPRESSYEYQDSNSVSVPLTVSAPATDSPAPAPVDTAPVVVSGPRVCTGATAKSETVFNNPLAGAARDGKLSNSRFAITNRLIDMIDCAAPGQTVAMSWFSFTDMNLVGHIQQAYAAGVNIRILVNSHATRPTSSSYVAVNTLRSTLGSNITAANANASTNPGSWISSCNSGCLTPPAKAGTVFPDESEGEFPALHSKFFLVTQSGSAKNIVGISSMNPTFEQARVGFNNASIVVDDSTLFNSMNDYYADLANSARGAGEATAFRQLKSESKSTSYYVYPKSGADDVLKMLQNVKCIYKEGGKTKRTQISVNMFVFTRNAPAMELWRKAFNSKSSNGGCDVKIIYTDLDQRIKALNTRTGETDFIPNGSKPSPWGAADCLSTLPQGKNGKPSKLTGPGLVYNAASGRMVTASVCKFGSLQGAVPTINKGGGYCWFNAKSKSSGGSLEMCASTPYKITAFDRADGRAKLEPTADSSGARWYTHQKYIAIDGMYANKRQKIVISGTPNITSPGLRWNDEILTFTTSGKIYGQHLADFNALKAAIMRRPAPNSGNTATASW